MSITIILPIKIKGHKRVNIIPFLDCTTYVITIMSLEKWVLIDRPTTTPTFLFFGETVQQIVMHDKVACRRPVDVQQRLPIQGPLRLPTQTPTPT
jgi:hypothetical protein